MYRNNDLSNLNKYKKITLLIVLTVFLSFLFIPFFTNNAVAIFYKPPTPSGPTSGFTDIEYEYVISNYEEDASWKFDWGDGNCSQWINQDESSDSISQSYSWAHAGEYSVRVKYRSRYLEESQWSDPLIVEISDQIDTDGDGLFDHEDDDIDGDGFTNENDVFPNDVDEWIDTDNDRIGDNADTDDDADGISDNLEEQLGSNPLDSADVIAVQINDETHYLIDTDSDGKSDKFYNTYLMKSSSLKFENSNTFLIDYNNDGTWDYSYDGAISNYNAPFSMPWTYLILTIILVVVIVLFILFRMGVFYVYEEEYEVEK